MGFFEDFTQRAAELGEAAVSKTRELGDIAKISYKISEEEKKLFSLFQSLGQSVFDAESCGEEKDFSEEIEAIKAQKALLVSLEKERAKLKKEPF